MTGNHESHRLAVLVCLLGFFLRILLPAPILLTLGVPYSGELDGNLLEKIHPGTYLIFLSLLILLLDHGAPLRQALLTWRQLPVFSAVLLMYLLLFAYWMARDPPGVGLLIDTHFAFIITAIVLSYAPRPYCRAALFLFLTIAVANSLAGIAESIGRFRIFTYDAEWSVLKEEHFRASALLGHPLNNAMFTAIALFVALSLRIPAWAKCLLIFLFLASLVAFGGRAALVFCVAGLLPVGLMAIKQSAANGMRLRKAFLLGIAALLLPIALAGNLYLLLHSGMGERLMSVNNLNDQSAAGRWLVFRVFHYMTPEEIWLGASANRVVDIDYRMGLELPMTDIENPWILMFMYFGALLFPLWLAATLAFAWRLMQGRPLALMLAVLSYYLIASTSNSFGRKDATYSIMAGAVICAGRLLDRRKNAV